MANQIHEELEKWPTISNFLFCTLKSCSLHDPAHTLHKCETHLETHQKEVINNSY